MAGEELEVVRLRDDFYRDGFNKVLISLATISAAIVFLILLSGYIFFSEPAPIIFATDNEWRILPAVPVNEVYLKTPDLIQWVSEVIPKLFSYDFVNFTTQQQKLSQYFTPPGWQKFIAQIGEYANNDMLQKDKSFLHAWPAGAPFILNQGLLEGRYSWWIQMPVNVAYINLNAEKQTIPLVIQALVVRIPTTDNLYGVAINNIIISKGRGNQIVQFNF